MPKHHFSFTVHIYDTDCYGVLWHGHYLRYLEHGRDEAVLSTGILLETQQEGGWLFPVREQHIRYLQPCRLRDVVTVQTHVQQKGLRLQFVQQVWRCDAETHVPQQLAVEATTTCVVCDSQFKPLRRLPVALVQALQQLYPD